LAFSHRTSLILTQLLPNLSSNDVLLQVWRGERRGYEARGKKKVERGKPGGKKRTEVGGLWVSLRFTAELKAN